MLWVGLAQLECGAVLTVQGLEISPLHNQRQEQALLLGGCTSLTWQAFSIG